MCFFSFLVFFGVVRCSWSCSAWAWCSSIYVGSQFDRLGVVAGTTLPLRGSFRFVLCTLLEHMVDSGKGTNAAFPRHNRQAMKVAWGCHWPSEIFWSCLLGASWNVLGSCLVRWGGWWVSLIHSSCWSRTPCLLSLAHRLRQDIWIKDCLKLIRACCQDGCPFGLMAGVK